MRKSVFILLAIVLCFALIVSCDDSPADNMTDSYRSARQSFYKATKIWLPEFEGVEISQIIIEEDGHWISLAFGGGEELFSQIAAVFKAEIKKEPEIVFDDMKMWDELQYTEGGQIYCGNIAVSIDRTDPGNTGINLFGHFFKGATVEVKSSPAAGGTVKVEQAGHDKGTKITTSIGSDLNLRAIPSDGYEFSGWYLGDTKLSDNAYFMDYKVPSSNVTIEGRFTEQETTAYYAALRGVFSRVFGVTLPTIAGIDATEYAVGDVGDLNGISTASGLKTWISPNPAYVVDLVGEDDVVASACVTILDAFNGFVEADSTHWRNSGEELSEGSGYYTAYYCTEDSLGEWTFDMAVMVYTEGDENYPSIDFNIFYP